MEPGKMLAHYKVEKMIGQGGMGEVYRGDDTKLGRDVALKILPLEFLADAERVARFQREAKVLASLNHPNIAAIFGFETTPEATFLVMELVEGEDLAAILRRGHLTVDEAVDVACQIAAGLEEAHEKGIVHRDLKPANVKRTPEGKVKVLDFGLARAYAGQAAGEESVSSGPTMTAAMTQVGTVLGTAAYMSPEQARGKEVDRRADIWAFGVILFEMLTGKQTFVGETATDTLAGILKSEPEWDALPTGLPFQVQRVLRRCLAKDPRQRLRDIGEARVRLENPDSESTILSGPVVALGADDGRREVPHRGRGGVQPAPALQPGAELAAGTRRELIGRKEGRPSTHQRHGLDLGEHALARSQIEGIGRLGGDPPQQGNPVQEQPDSHVGTAGPIESVHHGREDVEDAGVGLARQGQTHVLGLDLHPDPFAEGQPVAGHGDPSTGEIEIQQAVPLVLPGDHRLDHGFGPALPGQGQIQARKDFRDRARHLAFSVLKQSQMVGQPGHFVSRMAHVEYRNVQLAVQAVEIGQDLLFEPFVESGQGFVQKEHDRIRGQGASHRHALLFAARQLVRASPQQGPEAEHCHHLVPRNFMSPWRPALAPVLQVSPHIQMVEQAGFLEDVAYPAFVRGLEGGGVLPYAVSDAQFPLHPGLEARHRSQKGGLAAPGRAENRRHPAARQKEIHIQGEVVAFESQTRGDAHGRTTEKCRFPA